MIMAGLTGFFTRDAEEMRRRSAEKRLAAAKALEKEEGFKYQLKSNLITSKLSEIASIQKSVAEGKATTTPNFSNEVGKFNISLNDYASGKSSNFPVMPNFSKYVNILNDDYNTVFTDASGQKVRFKADIASGNIDNYRAYMQEIDTNYRKAKNDKGDYFKNKSSALLGQMWSAYVSSLSFVRSKESEGQSDDYESNNYLPRNEFIIKNGVKYPNPFYGGTALARALIFNKLKTKKQIRDDLNKTIKKNNASSTSGILKDNTNDNKVRVVSFDIPNNLSEGAKKLAEQLDTTVENLFSEYSERFYNVPNVKPENVKKTFLASLSLSQSISNISQLSPTGGGATYGTAKNVVDMNKIFIDSNLNFTELVFAIAPHMKIPKHLQEIASISQRIGKSRKKSVETIESYAGKNFAGRSADIKEREKSFKEAKANFQNQQAVQIALEKFLLERKSLKESEGKGIKTEFVAAFISKLRALKEVAIDAGSAMFSGGNMNISTAGLDVTSGEEDDNSADNDKTLTQGYLDKLKERAIADAKRYGGGTLDEKVGRLQAMRITLAFQMARAADPSGRLSNQDIEQQFVKLAGNFGTEASALAGIQVAIDEFKDKAAINKKIFDFVKEGDVENPDTYRVIDAVFVVNDIQRKAKTYTLLGQVTGSTVKKEEGGMNMQETYIPPTGGKPMLRYYDQGDYILDARENVMIDKQSGKVISPEEYYKRMKQSEKSEQKT